MADTRTRNYECVYVYIVLRIYDGICIRTCIHIYNDIYVYVPYTYT